MSQLHLIAKSKKNKKGENMSMYNNLQTVGRGIDFVETFKVRQHPRNLTS